MKNQNHWDARHAAFAFFTPFFQFYFGYFSLVPPGRRVNTLNSSFSSCACALGFFFFFSWTTHEHYYFLFIHNPCVIIYLLSIFRSFYSLVFHCEPWLACKRDLWLERRKKYDQFSRAQCVVCTASLNYVSCVFFFGENKREVQITCALVWRHQLNLIHFWPFIFAHGPSP